MSNPLAITSPAAGPPTTTAVPIASATRAPASVRAGSATVKQAYANAQGFEEMLLQQLSQSLVQSSGLSGESEAGGEGSSGEEGASLGGESSGMLASLLPQTLTEGVMRQGGLGLATQLMNSLDPAAASSAATAAGAGTAGAAVAPASTTSGASGAAPASTAPAATATGGAVAPVPAGAGSAATAPAETGTTGGTSA
jgi:Rod binding domain-containing protein